MQRKKGKDFIDLVTTSNLIQTKLTFLEDTTYTWKSQKTISKNVWRD